MKTIYILAIIIITANLSVSQTRITEVKYAVNPSDNRQSVFDTIIFLFDKNNLIEKQFSNEEPVTRIVYSYSLTNQLTMEKYYKNTVFKNSYKYEYDQSGKLLKEKCYDSKENLLFTNTLKYDIKGNLISKKSSISTGIRIENSYDSQNHNFKSIISNNSRNQKEIEYIYDDKGNVIQETTYQSLKKSKSGKRYQQSKIKFIYNISGKLSEKQNYLTDEVIEKYSYTYDDNGKLSKWEKFSPQGKLEFYVEYRYE